MGRACAWLAVLLGSVAADSTADEVSFAADIVPLLKSRCVMCHLPGSEQGGLALHPKGGYANLVDVKSTQSAAAARGSGQARRQLPLPQAHRHPRASRRQRGAHAVRRCDAHCRGDRTRAALDRSRRQALNE